MERLTAYLKGLKVSWVTIAVFAVVIAYSDGFWLTSLQGAVGAIERKHSPFGRWLRDSTLMLPLFALAVLAAMLLARRLVGNSRRKLVKVSATALLIVVISGAVGISEVAASSAYDYRLQTRHLELSSHSHGSAIAVDPGAVVPPPRACNALCEAKRETLTVHVRAVKFASMVLLISNLVLVAWVLALRSEQLWQPRRASDRSAVTLRRRIGHSVSTMSIGPTT